jgi:aspartyl-tRNA(Asn)/glutamyl-tRNA(Gln) amidotransferase subunit A
VGLKPGPGRVSTEDVIPLSPTLDFVGPMARTVEDAAVVLAAIFLRGRSPRSAVSGRLSSSRGRRPCLGIPREFFLDVLDPDVEKAFEAATRLLKKRGARLKDVSLPQLKETEDAGNQIAWAEATLYHQQAGWYPERAAEYGEDVRTRLDLGAKVAAVAYLRALEVRQKFIHVFHDVLANHEIDALVVPTTPIPAPRIGQDNILLKGATHPTRALLLRLNRPANLVGVPAISVPCGLTKSGLPVGLQMIAARTGEPLLLEIAHNFETACSFTERPDLEAFD